MSIGVLETLVNATIWALTVVGLPGLFALMVVESFGFPPLPSEVILPFAGFLVAQGTYPFAEAIPAALAGGVVGAYIAYAVGRWGRDRLAHGGLRFLRIEERHVAQMDAFFARRGEATVGIARMLPVVRSYISYPAGTARMDPVRFGLFTLLGATPFTVGLMYAGFVLRSHWMAVSGYLGPLDYVAAAIVVVGVVYLVLLGFGRITSGWPPRWRASGRAKN